MYAIINKHLYKKNIYHLNKPLSWNETKYYKKKSHTIYKDIFLARAMCAFVFADCALHTELHN